MSEAKALFVTATGTGVGKTFVACAIAAALRARGRDVGVMKPVATGCILSANGSLESGDSRALIAASGASDAMDLVTPVAFEPPLAPTAAARASGGEVNLRNERRGDRAPRRRPRPRAARALGRFRNGRARFHR